MRTKCITRRGVFIILTIAAMLLSQTVTAQDSIDDLFSDPDSTVDEQSPDAGNGEAESAEGNDDSSGAVDIAALTSSSEPIIKGSVSLAGSLVLGLSEWPDLNSDASLPAQVANNFDGSAYYEMRSTISADVRPTSYFRFFVSGATALDEASLSFPTPSISELFVDYTLSERVFFRVGKQAAAWGQGLLMGNPTNLLDDIGSSIAVKAFLPIGTNGLDVFMYSKGAWINDSSSPGLPDFAYAGMLDGSIGNFTLGIAGKYNANGSNPVPQPDPLGGAEEQTEPLGTPNQVSGSAYIKTALWGLDVSTEFRTDFPDDFSAVNYRSITNLFYEYGAIGLQAIGEYYFAYGPNHLIQTSSEEREIAPFGIHRSAIGLLFSRISSLRGWKPGIRWFHDYSDMSGQVVLGITGPLAPMLSLNFALPVVYGDEFGYYRQNNEDPAGRVISTLFQVSLSRNF